MNLLKQNPKTARYQTPNKPHLATSVRTAQRHAGAEQKSTTPITRSGVTGTDKRTRNSQHGITRARSDRRTPYHSGGADGGDGELLVVGVVLREQILGLLADVGEETGSLHGHGGGGSEKGTGVEGREAAADRKVKV